MVEGSMFIQIHTNERYGCPLMKDHIEGRKQEKLHSRNQGFFHLGPFIVGVP
jgi:hypothetical protein